MAFLFDASAVTNMIIVRGRKALTRTNGNFSLDLAGYEIGNAVWRLCLLEKKISHEEASDLLDSAADFLTMLRRIRFEDLNPGRILEVGLARRLTFYDASYLVAAEALELTLVTDDEKLSEAAKGYVPTHRSTQV